MESLDILQPILSNASVNEESTNLEVMYSILWVGEKTCPNHYFYVCIFYSLF